MTMEIKSVRNMEIKQETINVRNMEIKSKRNMEIKQKIINIRTMEINVDDSNYKYA